jgi:hypothetical protein
VGPDGKVAVNVALDPADAGQEVLVTIAPVQETIGTTGLTREQWLEALDRTAGSIDDPTFQKPPQEPLGPPPSFDE